ncbi:MAG TPA: methionine--tRNA ligase [Micromonosporaceae bacterium]|nr:methionine--tRNA ligase [Micromonosporaceae bacterium]
MTTYLTTTIPYVNAAPHLGFALEAVQADVLARHARLRGEPVRLLSGTDDNSLKNVLAADAAGVDVATFVDANADRFAALAGPLSLTYDDFIRTSRDPRHRVGVEALWRACAAAGDLYRDTYEGLYCVGGEHYVTPDELEAGGVCPEHRTPPQPLSETNWFFRLSRYAPRIEAAIESGELTVAPDARRNEVLSFIRAGLRDLSISRSQARARGWGIPVPGDPEQVVYVWWDALGNYVTSLGYGDLSGDTTLLDRWWNGADRRVHLIGKGVLRFHAVYWPALLLSAGLPLPTHIRVHDYLTVGRRKISKSDGTGIDPVALVDAYGVDAVRWWLLRDVPRVGDADFTVERLEARAAEDLAGGIGNVVNRVATMVHRFRDGVPPRLAGGAPDDTKELVAACDRAPATIDAALADGDYRVATAAILEVVTAANRCIESTAPWSLAKAAAAGDADAALRLDALLAVLVHACRVVATELAPLLPDAAARIAYACRADDEASGRLPVPAKVFDCIFGASRHRYASAAPGANFHSQPLRRKVR